MSSDFKYIPTEEHPLKLISRERVWSPENKLPEEFAAELISAMYAGYNDGGWFGGGEGEISGKFEETLAEYNERRAEEESYKSAQETRERKQLQLLIDKYGCNPTT